MYEGLAEQDAELVSNDLLRRPFGAWDGEWQRITKKAVGAAKA